MGHKVRPSTVRVIGRASLSNLGPGFDALGLCIDTFFDTLEARLKDGPGVRVESVSGLSDGIPLDPAANTAAIAAASVLRAIEPDSGLEIILTKGIPLGSGIGGSAASAVAGVLAANALLGRPLSSREMITHAARAEARAAGQIHGDNVVPSLLGGFVITEPGHPETFSRLEPAEGLWIGLLVPQMSTLTSEARQILPERVSFSDAVLTSASAARLVAAVSGADWETLGQTIMQDRLSEPVRTARLAWFGWVKQAALDAGAFGCALSGSGPSVFAICKDRQHTLEVCQAMEEALQRTGVEGKAQPVRPELKGSTVVS